MARSTAPPAGAGRAGDWPPTPISMLTSIGTRGIATSATDGRRF